MRQFTANCSAGFAAVVSIARRVLKGNFWRENLQEDPGAGPEVVMSALPGLQRPGDAVGPLTHRRYRIRIARAKLSPAQLIDVFRRDPNRLSPTSFAFFDPPPGDEGMLVGDAFTVRLPGPWDGPVSVTRVAPTSVRLETRDGHLEAGWIEFSAYQVDRHTVFAIESLARSGDHAIDTLYHRLKIAKLTQTHMWVKVLEAAARVSGGAASTRPAVETTIYLGRA